MSTPVLLDRPRTAEPASTPMAPIRPTRGWWAGRAKRVFDLTATLIGLVLVLPLLVGIALAVKLEDGGPVVFRQTRVGRCGIPFTVYKFRSMVLGAEERKHGLLAANEGAGPLFKLRRDPRVTPVGRVLRSLSLDELPQLLNVLNGTMSLVGPRPHLPEEVARMSPEARRRTEVRPGLSGLWQVLGRSELSVEESVRLDLAYVDGCSLALDLWILSRTAGAVLSARGAH